MTADALRRRADAARRLEPVDGRHGPDLGARDPVACWPPASRGPSTYGLSSDERRHEAERLLAAGWAGWEVVAVLVDPEAAAA